jgi:hypothetical protein
MNHALTDQLIQLRSDRTFIFLLTEQYSNNSVEPSQLKAGVLANLGAIFRLLFAEKMKESLLFAKNAVSMSSFTLDVIFFLKT